MSNQGHIERQFCREYNSPKRVLQDEDELVLGENPMLQYYLEGGQPCFTNRLAHGQPVPKKTRVKGLKKIVKGIERTLAKPSKEQSAASQGAKAAAVLVEGRGHRGIEPAVTAGWAA